MSIRIVTDSSCDLPQALVDEFGIAVVPLYINIGGESFLDGVTLSRVEFYEGLPHFESHPTTSVPGPGRFMEAFDKLAAEGASEILAVHVAGTLSAVVNSAQMAAKEWNRLPVTVFDSGSLTLGTGLQALAAARAASDGRATSEIMALLNDLRSRVHCFAALDTVESLHRSGRLTRFESSLASMLRIKPVLRMNNGEFEMERVRTRRAALARVIELLSELGPLEELALVHTQAPEEAEALASEARQFVPEGTFTLSAEVTPVIGTHIGPGAVGFVAVQSRRP